MKDEKIMIILSIVSTLFIIIILVFFNNSEIYIHNADIENEEIEHIALVYKFENYAWGHQDYVYIMDDDGSVYYEDFVENADEYEDDLLTNILSVYNNEEKIEYQFESFDDSFKERIYSTNYNWNICKKETMMDAGSGDYYCLLKMDDEYKLVKLQQWGDYSQISLKWDYRKICDYIDNIQKEIYYQEIN